MVDHDIHGEVYVESMFSNIRYLMDGNVYDFGIFKTLCIGGAYSVDKGIVFKIFVNLTAGVAGLQKNNYFLMK